MEVRSNSWERYLLSRWNNEKLILSHTEFTIGRGLTNTYILEHLQVSRTHCIFEEINGDWYLTDQSSNGTLLNKKRIPPKKRNILSNGDIIKLTDQHEFIFVNINKSSLDDIDLSIIIEEAETKFTNTDIHSAKLNVNKIVDVCSSTDVISSTNTNSSPKNTSNVIDEHTYCINVNNDIVSTSKNSNPILTEDLYKNKDEASSDINPITSETDINKEMACSSSTDNKEQPIQNQNINSGMDALEEAENELQCIICTELFIKATTLNCSHSFCKTCIEEWRKKNKYCPICRTKIITANPTIVLDNFITKVIEASSSDVKEKREEVIKSRVQTETKKAPATMTTRSGRRLRSRVTPPIEISSEEEYSYDDEDFIDHDYEYNGLPGRYYGGYGRCYSCGEGGHWANGCPYR